MFSWGRRFKFLAVGCLGLLLAVAFIYRAEAADSPSTVSLTTSPVTLNLNVAPGSSTSQTAEVMNNGSQPISINMRILTFGAYGNNGEAAITKFPANDPAGSYLKVLPSSFVAQPHIWTKVQVILSLPKSADLGFYYAIVFQPVYANTTVNNGAVIHGSNAVLALINTNSANEIKKVSVASFTVSHRLFDYLPATFSVNIRNSGNIYLAPHGDIFIARNSSGTDPISTLSVNSGGGNVLPDSNRIFTASWSDGFPVYQTVYKKGQPVLSGGQPVQSLKWNFSNLDKLRIGEYYAHLVMIYDSGNRAVLLTGTVSFWVIPWEVVIPLIIVVLIILLNLFLIGRFIYRRINRAKAKPQKS